MRGHVQFSRVQREDSCNEKDALSAALPPTRERVTVKRHRGEPGHTRDTRDTRAHAGTRITQTNLTTIHPNPTTHPHDHATAETAADSTAARTAAGPESTAPRGRLRRGRPQRTRPCLHAPPAPRAPPRACSKAVGETRANRTSRCSGTHRGVFETGAGTHPGQTGHTAARGHTDHTDEPHNHPSKPNDTPARPRDGRK